MYTRNSLPSFSSHCHLRATEKEKTIASYPSPVTHYLLNTKKRLAVYMERQYTPSVRCDEDIERKAK